MNKIILMGRLTRDPEVRYGQGANATAVSRFSIAVDRRFKREGQPETDFFNCTTFGKQAEFVEKYLKKGTKVLVTGSLQNDNYEKDGVKHYTVQIICDELEFAESKGSGSTQPSQGNGNGSQQPVDESGFVNVPDSEADELPFC